jgi:hypothetical protein
MSLIAYVDGQGVGIGDWVSFKSDVEQSGQIVRIKQNMFGGAELVLENLNGFHGDYIGGQTQTVERAVDCWLE